MQMEALESLPASTGLRRSSRLMKKPVVDRAVVIDLEDEIEEEEEWDPKHVSSKQMGVTAKRKVVGTGKVRGTKSEVEEKEGLALVGTAGNPISLWPSFETNVAKKVEKMSLEKMEASSQGIVGSKDGTDDSIAFAMGESALWQEVIALDPTSQEVDASSQQADVVDLSSSSSGSESGDDGDGDMGDIVEEEEEITTTLSSEDAALLAEVMKVIKEGGDLKKLKVESLKTYLRHYRLRMVGVKAVLLSRIEEHLKIKDGQAEKMYPRSSFSINCKGDVCLGDTVLFLQNAYDMPFDIERRCASGPPLGQRWVAGKVVNESYGTEKQQHTFTIEVLWSTGTRPFCVMRPVKVMGRNLYRLHTLRQLWPNEAERQKVLDEKHARGGRARALRRAVKSLKSRGRTKSRQDARVHPYLRSHTTEPLSMPPPMPPLIPPPMPPQNFVQYASIHIQDNVYQGSVPAPPAPGRTTSMQQRTHSERGVYPAVPRGMNFHGQQNHHEGFLETLSAPGPAASRGRNFHSQQNDHGGVTERNPAPGPTSSRGRNLQSQQSRYESSAQPDHVSLRVHVQDFMQHGRVHSQRQVHQGGVASQNPALPNHGRQQGAATIPCSNAGCEKPGAKQCISRSCGSCCSRNGTTRGRCPRHR